MYLYYDHTVLINNHISSRGYLVTFEKWGNLVIWFGILGLHILKICNKKIGHQITPCYVNNDDYYYDGTSAIGQCILQII